MIILNAMLLIGILAFITSVFIFPKKPERVYLPYAHYEHTRAYGVMYKSREECIAQARKSFRSVETKDSAIFGERENPNDGVAAPYEYGCLEYDHTGKPTGAIRR